MFFNLPAAGTIMKLISTPTYAAEAVEYLTRKNLKHLFGVVDIKPNSKTFNQVIKLGSVQSAMSFHMENPDHTRLCRYADLVQLAHEEAAQYKDTKKASQEETEQEDDRGSGSGPRGFNSVPSMDAEALRAAILRELADAFQELATTVASRIKESKSFVIKGQAAQTVTKGKH